MFIFATASAPRRSLDPTESIVQWVTVAHFLMVKGPRRGADCLPQSSVEVKNAVRYTSTLPFVFTTCCLIKHRQLHVIFEPEGNERFCGHTSWEMFHH
jgi:hypothetical protein